MLALLSTSALASTAFAQTVQLPTTRTFSSSSSVLVPDQGSAFLGGMSSAASGSSSRGFSPLRSRGMGSSRVASGMSVSAYVIDFEEMERELLASLGPEEAPVLDEATQAKVNSISRGSVKGSSRRGSELESVRDIKAQVQAEEAEQLVKIRSRLAIGEEAIAKQKWGLAKVQYEYILRNDKGEFAKLAKQRLAEVNAMASGKKKPQPIAETEEEETPVRKPREF